VCLVALTREIALHAAALRGRPGLPPVVTRLSGDTGAIEGAGEGLPTGAATPEAIAARLSLAGAELSWGEPDLVSDARAFIRLCHARGASSVDVIRADPSLLPYMQLGSFFAPHWRARVSRRLGLEVPFMGTLPRFIRGHGLAFAAELAFWRSARARATPDEWGRLTRSSYVVLYYHRIAGEEKEGQERLDVRPETFERQLRWLRRLRLCPVGAEELVAFHYDRNSTLPRRSFVLSADDGFRDAAERLAAHVDLRPYLFINTSAVGRTATWAGGEPVVSWEELVDLARRGAEVASHSHTHRSLPELDAATLAQDLTASLASLRNHLPAQPLLAYPHGRNDDRVRASAAAAGYRLAFTTVTGRNGAGTDPYGLKRVGLKEWDGPAVVAWKALTGELVPSSLERLKVRLHRFRRDGGRAPRRR
jgi:peptidoglycan/xylan/chitin deacetylase (PgdA/CDA1 family)